MGTFSQTVETRPFVKLLTLAAGAASTEVMFPGWSHDVTIGNMTNNASTIIYAGFTKDGADGTADGDGDETRIPLYSGQSVALRMGLKSVWIRHDPTNPSTVVLIASLIRTGQSASPEINRTTYPTGV